MVFGELDPRHHKFLYPSNSWRCTCKKIEATILFVDFSKTFDSIHTWKMEQIQLTYGLRKESVAAIIMIIRNPKVKVRSKDGDTHYFDIVADLQQENTSALYLFIINLDYMLRTSIDKMKDIGFQRTKKRSRRDSTHTITDTDYTDDIALQGNPPAPSETLLHCLERAAAGIGSMSSQTRQNTCALIKEAISQF